MKGQTHYQGTRQTPRFAVGPLLSLLALGPLWMPTPQLAAQQDNRQLNREQTQQSNGGAETRLALVIGNGTYTNAPPLKNPPNDARDMAATLKTLGFDVTSGINIDQREMKRLIREFGQKLKAGGSGLFYYAGHGVQSNGRNYLIPVEADIQSEAEVEDSSVDVNLVLKYMDEAQNGLNIVILDACRNNPFARSFRSASNGLAQVDAPTGTLIAYATAPGRVASDGTGENGLYTSELLKKVRVPGLSATEMFMRVRAEVMQQTNNKQVPWEASSLVGAFYFNASLKRSEDSPMGRTSNETKIDRTAVEREYWETIRSSNDGQDYRDYLESYPNGAYVAIARAKLRQIETSTNANGTSATNNLSGGQARVAICKEIDDDWKCSGESNQWLANIPFNILFENPTPIGVDFIGIVIYKQGANGRDVEFVSEYQQNIGKKNRKYATLGDQLKLPLGKYSVYIIDWGKRELHGHRGNLTDCFAKTVLTVTNNVGRPD